MKRFLRTRAGIIIGVILGICAVFFAPSEKKAGKQDVTLYEHTIRNNKDDAGSEQKDSTGYKEDVSCSEGDAGTEENITNNTGQEVPVFNTQGGIFEGIRKPVTPVQEVTEYISTLESVYEGEILTSENATPVVYYMQTDERWCDVIYGGDDTIGTSACGPVSMAMVVSTLTDIKIDAVAMAAWANKNGYWYPDSGSLHSVIPDTAERFGLAWEGVANDSFAADRVRTALKEGKLVVVLMGKGHFTSGGHFIVLRGIDDADNVYVADAASRERTDTTWKLSLIKEEARAWAGAEGPFWIISHKE